MQIQSIQLACHQPLAQSICMDAPKYNPTLSLVGEPIVEEMPSMKNKNRKPVQKCERPRNWTIQMLPNSEHARRLKLPGETAKSATSVRLRNPIRLLRYDCEIRIPAHPCTNQCQFNYWNQILPIMTQKTIECITLMPRWNPFNMQSSSIARPTNLEFKIRIRTNCNPQRMNIPARTLSGRFNGEHISPKFACATVQ